MKNFGAIIILFAILNCVSTELFSILTAGAILGGSSWYKWDFMKDNTYCRLAECCNSDYISYNITKLKNTLSTKMFGQPLVSELVNILSAHKLSLDNDQQRNRKALVISLHGWSGVGKNYAATMIADALYSKGVQSKYVNIFMGKKDFDCNNLEISQRELVQKVINLVKQCSRSLIIFDEIHDMCPTVLDAIKPMLDHHHTIDGVDFRDTIFIFISNIGGQEIANALLELYDDGYKRNDVEFHHFEPILRRVAYYTGGFEKSSTIAHHLIDHYIPFLPLEQSHVISCAKAEFMAHGMPNPTEKMMEDALSVITYGPREDKPIFANNGCKRFTRHIPYIIEKHRIIKKEEL